MNALAMKKISVAEQKKIDKAIKKKERQELIDKHTEICVKTLEDSYDVLLREIDIFNLELVEMASDIGGKKQELEKYISLDDIEKIKENIKETFDISSGYFKRITEYVTPGGKGSITEPLAKANDMLNKYLNNLELSLTLVKNKNATYITSSVFNKLQNRSDEYCKMVCEDFYTRNDYFKAYINMYYDYEEVVKLYRRELIKQNRLEDDLAIENVDIQIQKDNSCNGRLRVTHADMMDFARYMGFKEDRQGNSTHRVFRHPETGISVPIPAKKGKDLPQGTMSMLLKQMGYKRADLAKFIAK